jgi:hypothetical protein
MRALETEQHAAAPNGNHHAEDPRPVHSPPQPRTLQGRPRRRLRTRRRWVIACTLAAATVAALFVVEVTLGGGMHAPRHPGRALATGTPPPTASLSAATARFLDMEHAADRTVSQPRPQSARVARARRSRDRQTLLRVSTRSSSGSPSGSASTSSTSGTSEAVDTTEQSGTPSSGPPSTSASSGSGQGSPAIQPHSSPSSNSGSSSASPSKATLRSLVTGAGTCSCQ